MLREDGLEGVVDKGRLAAARHTRDADEPPERELDVDALEVVPACSPEPERVPVARAARRRHLYAHLAAEVLGSERVCLHHLGRRTGEDHFAAQPSGLGAHVDHIVGSEHHVAVMFDDDDRIAQVAQFLE